MSDRKRFEGACSFPQCYIPCKLCKKTEAPLPPTPGFNKLGPAAQAAARSRAKAFYPFD